MAKEKKIKPVFYSELDISKIKHHDFTEKLHARIDLLRRVEARSKGDSLYSGPFHDYKAGEEEDDRVSHFVARLVCSSIEWVSKWFVENETLLFKIRAQQMAEKGKEYFYAYFLPHMQNVETRDGTIYIGPESYYDTKCFHRYELKTTYQREVHFTKVSADMSARNDKFKLGWCKVTDTNAITLMAYEFKKYLGRRMDYLVKKHKELYDDRLDKACSSIFVVKSSNIACTHKLNIQEINDFSPICIKQILKHLTTYRHLKYNDRQALCLYFKGLGVDVNDTIDFFRKSFNVSGADFDGKYLYNIRHNYGLEGKKADYTCFSCTKMALNLNSVNKSGCPFSDNKDFIKNNISPLGINIEDIYGEPMYNRRCTALLDKITGRKSERNVNMPTKYFNTLKSYHNEKNVKN